MPTAAHAQLPTWLYAAVAGHTWPMLGSEGGHGGYSSHSGPDDATILAPWPFAATGAIVSSAVIDRRQWIYFGTDDNHLLALRPAASRAAGLLAWQVELDGPLVGSPALSLDSDGQTLVYAATEQGTLYALRDDGSERWHLDVQSPVLSSLTLTTRGADTWLYLKAGADLVSVRDDLVNNSGSVVWRQALSTKPNGHDNTPALTPDGSLVVATDLSGEISILDALSGSPRCSGVRLGGTPTTPVVDADGYVYVGIDDAGHGSVESWELAGLGCRLRFSTGVGGPVSVAPTLIPGGLLLVQDGADLVAIERVGGLVRWTEPAPWSGSAAAVADGSDRLFVPGTDRRVHAFRIDGAGALAQWQLVVDQVGGMAAPAIDALGRLVVPSVDQHVYVLQSLPAFMVAFASDLASTDLELHTLREIYGEIDPPTNPWARILRRTERPDDDTQPAYSVDTTLLAWSTRGAGPADIVLAASGGGGGVAVTDDDGSGVFAASSSETDPAFSPVHPTLGSRLNDRGFYLAMTFDGGDGKDLRFLDLARLANGRSVEDLESWLGRQLRLPLGSSALAQLLPAGEQRSQPAFAPDGGRLAYSACRRQGSVSDLYLVIQDLHQPSRRDRFHTVVSADCPEALERGFAPAFSPDGAHIVYHLYGGGLRIDASNGSGSSVILPDPSGAKPLFPSWSPDGTEIVAAGDYAGLPPRPRTLYVFQGARYQSVSALSTGLSSSATFDAPEHHPALFPEPLLDVDCTAPGAAPSLLLPQSARPGEVVEVFGCGFDIKVWQRQQVEFVHALDTSRTVAGVVRSASVDVATGLGVLEVEVPYLAGNGPLSIATPFGSTDTGADVDDCRDDDPTNDQGCFTIEPLTVALWQPETVIGARIRVAGYGLQVLPGATPSDPRLDRVFFTGANGGQNVPAVVHAVRLEPCGPSTVTPCPPNAPLDQDGQRRVEWLEVTVPPAAHAGPVTVVGAGAASGHSCCSLGFLEPTVSVTPNNGSQGNGGAPGQAGGPTFFDMRGDAFPFDPYFDYRQAELAQISPDRQSGAALASATLGAVELTPDAARPHVGSFEQRGIAVLPDATGRGGELHMEASGTGSGARAFARFRTPLRGLPIIFVPGTSGTFLTNTSGGDLPSPCTGFSYPRGENIWMSTDTILKIASPAVHGVSFPLPLGGCQEYLYQAAAFSRTNDSPRTPGITPSRVIDQVSVPVVGVKKVYQDLIDFLRSPTGLGRVPGNPSTGACVSAAANCFYLFPLDWRRDYASQAVALGNLVRAVKTATGQPKVVIVGHSMGGPVIDYYLRSFPLAEDDVDQVVTLGGGYLGVGLPYRILQKGHDWGLNPYCCLGLDALGLEVLDLETTQRLAIDWPTAYWQLPSEAWFDNPNGACDGECWIVQEDEWDVDGDGACGSRTDGTSLPCSGPLARGGRHRNATRTLDFMRNAEHDGCDGCEADPGRPGDHVNVSKFDDARALLLDTASPINRNCQLADGTQHSATLGDWRCGTGDVFYHRIVGFGADTDGRMHFYKTSICARWETVAAIGAGVFGGLFSPVAALACVAREERRDVLPIDGDHTVPLRSAVGILDHYDDRIWGIDWRIASSEVSVYHGDPERFHGNLPNDPRFHALLRDIAGGLISNVSQRPVPVSSGFLPYFRVPHGNPQPPAGTPAFSSLCSRGACARSPQAIATASRAGKAQRISSASGRESANRLRITITGNAALHVFDGEGRHRGTPSPEVLDLDTIPGVGFDADPTETRAVLPLGSESGYRLEIRHGGLLDAGGAPIEVPIGVKIEGLRDRDTLWVDRFDGLPILATTVVEITLGDGTQTPIATVDAMGDGSAVPIEAVTLEGEELDDALRPRTTLSVEDGRLTLEASDEGGAGVDQVLYGYDRDQTAARLYQGPLQLPAGIHHVWAYATDRAGNVEAAQTWDAPECSKETPCVADVALKLELVEGDLAPGNTVVLRAEAENVGELPVIASSLRLVLSALALHIEDAQGNDGRCEHFLDSVFCDLDALAKGARSSVVVWAKVLGEEAPSYRLEALTGELLEHPSAARLSGVLKDEK